MKFDEIRTAKVILIIKNDFNKIIHKEEASIGKLLWLTNLQYISAKELYEFENREIEHMVWEFGEPDPRYLNYSFDEFRDTMMKENNLYIESEDDDLFYDGSWYSIDTDEPVTYVNISKIEDVETLINKINSILELNPRINFSVMLK